MLHLDLKSDNIFISSRDNVKIADIGISVKIDSGEPSSIYLFTYFILIYFVGSKSTRSSNFLVGMLFGYLLYFKSLFLFYLLLNPSLVRTVN